MQNEELILDIVEKTYDKVEILSNDINEIKIEQAGQNIIVKQHEARSTASEARLSLLEKDAQFFRNFIMIITGLCTIAGVLVKFLPYLLTRL